MSILALLIVLLILAVISWLRWCHRNENRRINERRFREYNRQRDKMVKH